MFVNKSILKNLQFKYQFLETNKQLSFYKLLSKPDLIVIFDSDKKELIIKESFRAKIPIIIFNSNFHSLNKNNYLCYDIPGNFNFNTKTTNDFFFKIINSILK